MTASAESVGALAAPAPGRDDIVLRTYRVIAYIVGVGLPILAIGAIYGLATAHGLSASKAAGRPTAVKIVGPIHGFLYITLILLVLTMFFRERWPIPFTVLVLAAGTIPLLSFVAEHYVTRRVRARRAEQALAAHPPG